jgi:cytochrome P450
MDTSAGPRPAAPAPAPLTVPPAPLTVPPAAAPPAAGPPRFVSDPAQVRAVLADPEYTVPDPGRGAPPRTMAWLRQNVARFSNGADHARRRDLAEDLLRPLDTGLLRAAARDQANAVIDEAAGCPFDVMALVARRVPGLVLAAALGAADPEQVIGRLAPVAAVYQPGPADPGMADGSVARLAELLPGGPDEQVAARIGLLIQAFDATAGLIGNAVAAGLRVSTRALAAALADTCGPAAALVEQTLRIDPPVLVTRRVAPSGAMLTLDLASAGQDPAGHLEFGSGLRACPGAAHACALAEGAIEPLLARCRWTGAEISYPAPPALRAPARLEVAEA